MSKRTKIIIIVVVIVIVIGGTIYFIRKSKKAKTNAKLNGTPTSTTDTATAPAPAPKTVRSKTVRSVARDASGAAILKDNSKSTAVTAE